MTQSLFIHPVGLNQRVADHYMEKDSNLTDIFSCMLREAKSMNLYILDVYITKDHKLEIMQPELMKFDDLIAQIDEEIELCKLLGVKDA